MWGRGVCLRGLPRPTARSVCVSSERFFIFVISFPFCIFGYYTFLSAVLLFYGSQFIGFVPFW